jgi:hypothetical protein
MGRLPAGHGRSAYDTAATARDPASGIRGAGYAARDPASGIRGMGTGCSGLRFGSGLHTPRLGQRTRPGPAASNILSAPEVVTPSCPPLFSALNTAHTQREPGRLKSCIKKRSQSISTLPRSPLERLRLAAGSRPGPVVCLALVPAIVPRVAPPPPPAVPCRLQQRRIHEQLPWGPHSAMQSTAAAATRHTLPATHHPSF